MKKEDIKQFRALAGTPIRSEEREAALHAWDAYKRGRQMVYFRKLHAREFNEQHGLWLKGWYIQALTAPAIDLRGETFKDYVCVGYADLRGARLDRTRFNRSVALKGAKLEAASLKKAHMPEARLMDSDLRRADFTGADLTGADLSGANLAGANLTRTKLAGANLAGANLVGANVKGCNIDGARVYGVAAWDLEGEPKTSKDLVVTPEFSPAITADDIRVAQFIYLLINNPEIRNVLDTVTRKVVLLLGRFTPKRKAVLDALRDELRRRNFVPVMFDFEPSSERDLTETVTLLARMARFVIADLTDPASIPQELQAVAPNVEVPIRLIIEAGRKPYAMSCDLKKYPWVIKPYHYADTATLMKELQSEVIDVAEASRKEIAARHVDDNW